MLAFSALTLEFSGVWSKLKVRGGEGLHLSEILTSQQRGMVMVILKLKKIWGLSPTPTPATYMYVTCSNKSGGGGSIFIWKVKKCPKKRRGEAWSPTFNPMCQWRIHTVCSGVFSWSPYKRREVLLYHSPVHATADV